LEISGVSSRPGPVRNGLGPFNTRRFGPLFGFWQSPRPKMVRKNTGFGCAGLRVSDCRFQYQLQADVTVEEKRPRHRDFRFHTGFEAISRLEHDLFTADHPALAEAVHGSISGHGLKPQL
jgi:hypothetical protein